MNQHIRQSVYWEKYFKFLKWQTHRTSKGVLIVFYRIPLVGAVSKVQRPELLSFFDVDEILSFGKTHNFLFVKLEPNADQDTSILENRGFVCSKILLSPATVLNINLKKSQNDLFNDLHKSAKYSVNRARREGSFAKIIQKPGDTELKNFHEMLTKTGRQKNFYVQPYKDLQAKRDIFGENSYLALVFNKDKEITGAKFFVGDGKTIWFIHGGNDIENKKDKSGYLLMWDSILFFKEKNYEVLDLEGMYDERFTNFTKDWAGFSNFKQKFGGEIVRYPMPYVYVFKSLAKPFANFF